MIRTIFSDISVTFVPHVDLAFAGSYAVSLTTAWQWALAI